MLTKELGATGVQLPEVGLGTWKYHGGPEPLRRGIEAGAAFIDTAESYGSEAVVAEAIAGVRDRVFLATKVSPGHFRRQALLAAADQSLRTLRTDWIDLYQLHAPNPAVPLEETLGAMEELVDAGKVRYIGVSNFSIEDLSRAQRALRRHPLAANQVRYNLADRTIESGLLAYCAAQRITVIAYSPLNREIRRIQDADPRGVWPAVAAACGRTPAQVALNWCLCRPPVVVIPKGSSVAHVLENCGASDWRLTAEQVRQLDAGIAARRRGALEMALRRSLPAGWRPGIQRAMKWLPAGLRRRLH